MLRIIGLLAIAPLFLAATCADPKYPIATWQTVQDARQHEAVMPLEWDSSLLPSVAERGQNLVGGMYELYGLKPSVNIYPWGQSGHLCEIMGAGYKFSGEGYFGSSWMGDYTARKCLLDPQYRHAAIVAYEVGGEIAEVMWLTTD
jgi:hypothetical protein